MIGPGHLAEVEQDPACAKIPFHTHTAGETSQVCPGPPDVPKCPVRGQPVDNFGGTGLCLQLPLHSQVQAGAWAPLSHPPDEDAGRKHDCEWHKWGNIQAEPLTVAGDPGPKGSAWFPPFAFCQLMPCVCLEGSTALLERQRLWQSLPLRLQDPLPGPGLRLLVLPTPPFIWVTSPAVPEKSSQDMAWIGSCLDPQAVPGCRIPPGSMVGMNLAPSSDRSYIQQQRSPQARVCLWISDQPSQSVRGNPWFYQYTKLLAPKNSPV